MKSWNRSAPFALVLLGGLLGGCGDGAPQVADGAVRGDAGPPPGTPERRCPGEPGCMDVGDGVLHVGAAREEVTPAVTGATDVQTVDTDMNGEYDPGEGDRFADNNGNGRFDGIWIAGFGNARAAAGVRDPQWATALALRTNDVTMVLVAIDCIAYFKDEIDKIRARVADLDVDFVAVSATHTHEGRDTMGIWGVSQDESGLDPAYMRLLVDRAEMAIRRAVAALAPATVQYATYRLRDQPGGQTRYVSDSRDPYAFDDEVRLLRFAAKADGAGLATLVNLSAHPEYMGDANQLLSSDFVHALRRGLEEGVVGPDGGRVSGVGGTTLFMQGAIGSQIGPNRIAPARWDGTPLVGRSAELADTIGEQLAYFGLRALGPSGGSVTDETATLGFRYATLKLRVQNRGFHVAFLQGLFDRSSYDWNPELSLIPGVNEPSVITEIAVIDIGRAQALTVPGEIDPVLWIGGYDGSYTPTGVPIVDTTQTNPPDLSRAPAGPYLRDQLRADAEYRFIFGLCGDELGYFIPDYDFELDPLSPYLDEAPGDHYEETNSIGVDGWRTLHAHLTGLLAWRPEAR